MSKKVKSLIDEKIIEEITEGKGTVLIYVDESGELVFLTSGVLSRSQTIVLTKVITIVDDHSIVLKCVLGIEIFFNSLVGKFKRFIEK